MYSNALKCVQVLKYAAQIVLKHIVIWHLIFRLYAAYMWIINPAHLQICSYFVLIFVIIMYIQ